MRVSEFVHIWGDFDHCLKLRVRVNHLQYHARASNRHLTQEQQKIHMHVSELLDCTGGFHLQNS